jgi:hypothetical protein
MAHQQSRAIGVVGLESREDSLVIGEGNPDLILVLHSDRATSEQSSIS